MSFNVSNFISDSRKAVVAGVGSVLTALVAFGHLATSLAAVGVTIPTDVTHLIGVALALLTPIATWLVPNKPALHNPS